MLMRIFDPKRRAQTSQRGHRRRHAEVPALLVARPGIQRADPVDWMSAYPCMRMHGAAFEAEFYRSDDADAY